MNSDVVGMQSYRESLRPTVYFLEAVGLGRVKIGFTRNPVQRFIQIRTSCPNPVETLAVVPGSHRLEAALHSKFASRRGVGEWFSFDQDERDGIAELRHEYSGEWINFWASCMVAGLFEATSEKPPPFNPASRWDLFSKIVAQYRGEDGR